MSNNDDKTKVTGLDKLFNKNNSEDVTNNSNNNSTPVEDTPQEKAIETNNPEKPIEESKEDSAPIDEDDEEDEITFDMMIDEMKDFITNHYYAKRFALSMIHDKNKNAYIIFQGTVSSIFAVLYPKGRCRFPRTTFLRTIRNLPKDSILFRYFKNYTLVR